METVLNRIKGYIARYYLDLAGGQQYTYNTLRGIVREAWDSITPKLLEESIGSIKECCQAVIDAQGGCTQ